MLFLHFVGYFFAYLHFVTYFRWLTGLGFDLAWFSSLSSERFCIFGLLGPIYIYIYSKKSFKKLGTSFALPFSELSLVGLALDLVD